MTRGNPCLMVQGSAKALPAHFEIRSSELRPGIQKNQEHKVICAVSSEEDQDSSFHSCGCPGDTQRGGFVVYCSTLPV